MAIGNNSKFLHTRRAIRRIFVGSNSNFWSGRKDYHHDEEIGSYTFNLDILEFANQPNGFENYFSSQFGLAEKLYNAYGDSAEWKNYFGSDMPKWSVLPEKIKDHWRAVAYSTLKLDNK